MLFGAVAMVLLIACANLAGLLFARNTARSRELALRSALGAPRRRIARQLLLEALVLALAGGLAGLGVAATAARVLSHARAGGDLPYVAASNALPQFSSGAFDFRMLAFALGVSLATAVLFGMAPAFTGSRIPSAEALKEGGRSAGAGVARQRLRRTLVIAEVGLSLVLVFVAALLGQTVVRLERQDPGFPADHLLLAHVFVPPARYADADAITAFCDAFGEKVRVIPGVRDGSVATGYPPSLPWKQTFTVPGSPVSRAEDVPVTRFAAVDRQFLRTLGLELVAGRDFAETDVSESRPVAIVNQEFARRYFPGRDPIGREISPGPPEGVPPIPLEDFGSMKREIAIVGVVRNFMNDGPAQPTAPQLFMLYRQIPGLNFGFKDLIVRTTVDPESIAPAVAQVLKSLDEDIPLGEVHTMEAHLGRETADRRFTTVVLGSFAGLGLLLAVIGAYGVISLLVSQRTRELGVRLALGADASDILRLVLRYGLSIAASGVALGLVGAVAVRRSIAALLYGVTPSDLRTLLGASGLLIFVILAASAVPAVRAMRIDPVEALRSP
jgi:putative ABC transport system permease protein